VDHDPLSLIERINLKSGLPSTNSMMETLHLLKSPSNAKHLEKSLKQYRRGKTKALVDVKSAGKQELVIIACC
jgi:hypothetical protein